VHDRKFDPAKLERLNDPERLEKQDPDALWAAADAPDASAVVDVGAGTGLFAFEFARRMGGGTVYACDTEEVMLEWIRAHTPPDLPADIVTVRSEENRLPLRDGVADLVVMLNLHHELHEPTLLLADAARVSRPGARLLVVDWKAEETPRGPALAIRVTPERICEDALGAGWSGCEIHEPLEWHSVVTATLSDA
jgi:ubiquinone/menaquinone biosynthesis C-methylase UbiE